MNDLVVTGNKGQVVTTSRKLAEVFGKSHNFVLKKIDKLKVDDLKTFNEVNFALVEYQDAKGEFRKEYLLNRKAYSFIAMGFTGKTANKFKLNFLDAFDKMESYIHRIEVERASSDWQISRIDGKMQRRTLTDMIAPFCIYAISQGSKGTAKNAYSNFTRLVNKHCGIKARERDLLTPAMLRRVATLEGIVELKITELMKEKMYCKDIYQVIKSTIPEFCNLVPYDQPIYLPNKQ